MLVMSVYDAKAEAFGPPFFEKTLGLSHRAFAEVVNTYESVFNKHPEDFTLFCLGEFEPQSGRFDIRIAPEPVVSALEVYQAPQMMMTGKGLAAVNGKDDELDTEDFKENLRGAGIEIKGYNDERK